MSEGSESFKNELFVVLIPDGEVLQLAKKLQKKISDHYNIYKEGCFPQIHITINKVDKNDKNKLLKITSNLVSNWNKPIKLSISDFDCYYLKNNNNFLVLRVEKNETLSEFANLLQQRLLKANINLIEDYNSWDFHITIISNLFAKNPLNEHNFKKLCSLLNNINKPNISKISSQINIMEIWKPVLQKEDKFMKRYYLS